MSQAVYLDYAATTPVDPRVVEVMMRHLGPEGTFANPASRSHLYGWLAEEAVENARRQVADALNADPREIVWTSGATPARTTGISHPGYADSTPESGPVITGSNTHTLTTIVYSDTGCTNEANRTSLAIGQCSSTPFGDAYIGLRQYCNGTHYVTAAYGTRDCSGDYVASGFPLDTCAAIEAAGVSIPVMFTCSGAAAASALVAVVAVLATLVL